MPCDATLKKNQTIQQRAVEVRTAAERIDQLLAAQRVEIKIGPQGAVAFVGIPDDVRDGLTDGCIYRRIMAGGSRLAIHELEKAQRSQNRAIDPRVVAQGVHLHGETWHGRG